MLKLRSYKSLKDEFDSKDKRIRELESKLTEYRFVDLIYQGKLSVIIQCYFNKNIADI